MENLMKMKDATDAELREAHQALGAQIETLRTQRRALAEELDVRATQERLTKDLGLSEKGIATLRQIVGPRGVASAESVIGPGAVRG